jgi:hypothetical protein
MATSEGCCHLTGAMLNLAAEAADRARIALCRGLWVALEPVALMAKEHDLLERRMNVIVRGVEEIDVEWKAKGYMKKAYDMEQAALIAHAKAPEYTWKEYKEAIQQCVSLGKDLTHSKRPMKV